MNYLRCKKIFGGLGLVLIIATLGFMEPSLKTEAQSSIPKITPSFVLSGDSYLVKVRIDIPDLQLLIDSGQFPIKAVASTDGFKQDRHKGPEINKTEPSDTGTGHLSLTTITGLDKEKAGTYEVRLENSKGESISNVWGPCKVTSAEWSPWWGPHYYPYKAMIDAADKTPYIIHMKIKTQNCAGKRLNIHIVETFKTVDPKDSPVEADLNRTLVDEKEFLDIPSLPGENECYIRPCKYYIKIDKSDDGAVEEFYSDEDKDGNTLLNGLLYHVGEGATLLDPWIIYPADKQGALGANASTQPSVEETREYTLLAPLPKPGGETLKTFNIQNGLSSYLTLLFQILIGIAGVLSVIMIVIGGVEYMSTDAMSGKEEGLKKLNQAVLGLLIALGAWLLLNTINPQLVGLSIGIKPAGIEQGAPAFDEGQQNNESDPSKKHPDANGKWCGVYIDQAPWPTIAGTVAAAPNDDVSIRGRLVGKVAINHSGDCTYVGQSGCTSLDGLSKKAVDSLLSLRAACGCQIVITAGTECWNHGDASGNGTAHKPGNGVVDLRQTSDLNKFIWGKSDFPNDGKTYTLKDGSKFLAERSGQFTSTTGIHWHVISWGDGNYAK